MSIMSVMLKAFESAGLARGVRGPDSGILLLTLRPDMLAAEHATAVTISLVMLERVC